MGIGPGPVKRVGARLPQIPYVQYGEAGGGGVKPARVRPDSRSAARDRVARDGKRGVLVVVEPIQPRLKRVVLDAETRGDVGVTVCYHGRFMAETGGLFGGGSGRWDRGACPRGFPFIREP